MRTTSDQEFRRHPELIHELRPAGCLAVGLGVAAENPIQPETLELANNVIIPGHAGNDDKVSSSRARLVSVHKRQLFDSIE